MKISEKHNGKRHKVAIDFGGTLLKVATYCGDEGKKGFSFASFPVKDIDVAFNYINQYAYSKVYCTGGGAVKYRNLIQSEVKGSEIVEVEEVDALQKGLMFFIEHSKLVSFKEIAEDAAKRLEKIWVCGKEVSFPLFLVNIGTGTSIIEVKGASECCRVSGTPLGGGTFYALAKLLNPGMSYAELAQMAAAGNSRNVDLTVGDIYGGRVPQSLNLSLDMLACSFGKIGRSVEVQPKRNDVCSSLLEIICYNTCQLAVLNERATFSDCKCIIFTGSFVGNNEDVQQRLWNWTKFLNPQVNAYFLEYGEYVGGMGALVKSLKEDTTEDLTIKFRNKFIYN